jgi:hypothetical protein
MSNDDVNHHDHEKIVEVATLPMVEAELVVAQLKAAGIDALTSGDDINGLRQSMSYAEGYRVMVFEKDVEAARQVIADDNSIDEKSAGDNSAGDNSSEQ